MDTLTNELETEETVPVRKSIFKRQASTSIPGFDVSLNESNSKNSQFDKSDTSPTISAPKKSRLFKKPKKPAQHNFSVNFEESNANSETETSMTNNFSKTKVPFERKVISNSSITTTNQFDVTFNETNANLSDKNSLEEISKDLDDESTESISLTAKSNPFKKPKTPLKSWFNVNFDETNNDDSSALSTTSPKVMFIKKVGKPLDQFQVSFNETNNDLGSDASNITESKLSQEDFSRKNVFAKPMNKNIKDAFNMEYEESDFGESSEVTSTLTNSKCLFRAPRDFQNFEVSFSPTVPQTTSSQEPISRNEGVINSNLQVNDEEENCVDGDAESSNESSIDNGEETSQENDNITSEELHEKSRSIECENNFENLSSNKSQLNLTNRSNRSDTNLHQSSINDENLNFWMSDHSDEEIQPPIIPPSQKNASFTEEAPQAPEPVSPTQICTMTWEQKFTEMVSNIKKKNRFQESNHLNVGKVSKTQAVSKLNPDKGQKNEKTKKATHPKLAKPAYFANKRLYQYVIKKLEPKFGIDAVLQSEQIVLSICDTVKKVERKKTHQKKLIQDLKKEMASVGLIETTVDFYEFVIKFLPHSFRVKVIPCVQPRTNTVFPPRDTINPFDKIL